MTSKLACSQRKRIYCNENELQTHNIAPAHRSATNLLHGPAVESFVDTDQKYLQADSGANRDDGCTAVTAVLVGQNLVVANVGDSRAVLSRGGQGTVQAAHPPVKTLTMQHWLVLLPLLHLV